MPKIISTEVDLDICPSINVHAKSGLITPHDVITIGDAHGNVMRVLSILANEGIINLNNTYKDLLKIYLNHATEKIAIADFRNMLTKMTLRNPCGLVRFIGDEVADRGNNDLLMLFLFEALDCLGLNFEIILSNHALEFLKQYVSGLTGPLVIFYQDTDQYQYAHFGQSLYNLIKCVKEGVISETDVCHLVEKHYLPKLHLLAVNYDELNHEVYLFTHAPVDFELLEEIWDLFPADENLFEYATASELYKSAKQLRYWFQRCSKNNELIKKFINLLDENNRYILYKFVSRHADEVQGEPMYYKVINLHGHIGESKSTYSTVKVNNNNINEMNEDKKTAWTYVNLDTNLGKNKKNMRGKYLICVSSDALLKELEHCINQKNSTLSVLHRHDLLNHLDENVSHKDDASEFMQKIPQLGKMAVVNGKSIVIYI